MLFSDCPNNGLCCFDGCADTCVDGPRPSPVTTPSYSPPPPTTPSYSPPPPPQVTTPSYRPDPAPVVAEEETIEIQTEVKPESEGYSYPVPDIPFELPVPSKPPPGLPTLYEVPF